MPDDVLVELAHLQTLILGVIPTIEDMAWWSNSFVELGESVREVVNEMLDPALQTIFEAFEVPQGTPDSVQNQSNFLTVAQQIQLIYTGYFGREPDPAGREFWEIALSSGAITPEELPYEFYLGALADTGGEADKALLNSITQVTSLFAFENGMTDRDVAADLTEQIASNYSEQELSVLLDNLDEIILEATDGDGVDDSLTVTPIGIIDSIPGL